MDQADLFSGTAARDGFRVVIPTRDSAGWIDALVSAYNGLDVRPLFVVDKRSTDDTLGVLRRIGADAIEVLPVDNCVEDIIWRLASLTDARWLLRMDDDELPARAMLDWVRVHLEIFTLPTVAFPRRWAMRAADGSLRYAEHRHLFYIESQPTLLDPQIRLYQPDKVNYLRRIHSPGFTADAGMHVAPTEAFICHFDWIARTFEERRAKLMRYEAALPGCAGGLLYFYLPELLPLADRCETRFETSEFDTLAGDFTRYRLRARTETIAA